MDELARRSRSQGQRAATIVVFALATVLLASCGGGGSSSSSQTPPPAASLNYPSSPQVCVVGTAIASIKPTITGTLSNFSVSPALPAGLVLDASTGIISGTPTAVAAKASYTISAVRSNGASVIASVSITVNAVAPSSLSYGASAFTFTASVAGRTLTPNASGGSVVSWSVSPALPAGLAFSTTDGSIAGTPTAASASTVYVVTAANSGGQSTVNLTIEVDAGVLLELGHEDNIALVRFSGSRILSQDARGHWVLWDYAAAAIIAKGDSNYPPSCCTPGVFADLAGSSAVIKTQSGFEVYSSSNGQVLATIIASVSWWMLASDGSYISAGSQAGLFAWSPSGQLLFSRSGDYSKAIAFSAPGQVRVATGPAGQSVVETVSVPSGTASTSPAFNGQFSSWFVDGGRFLTIAGTTALVYSLNAVQQAAVSLPTGAMATGQGNWVWTYPNMGATLKVYAVGASSTPAASYTLGASDVPFASATTIGVIQYGTGLSVIDLSGAAPSRADYTTSITHYPQPGVATYAAVSASQWVVGNQAGVLLDGASLAGTPRYFGFGQAWSIAGSTGHIAIATASGSILYFDANTLVQEGTIPFSCSRVLLSSDGSVLAAAGDVLDAQYSNDWSLKVYSLPSGTLLHIWAYGVSGGVFPQGISLSGSGTVLGQVLFTTSGGNVPSFYTQQANASTGGSPIFSDTFNSNAVQNMPPPIRLSPDGSLIATSTWGDPHAATPPGGPGIGTNIRQNGTLVTAVSGWPVGWIDTGRLLVSTYTTDQRLITGVYAGCTIYDPSGHSVGSCALPEVLRFQTVTSDSLYAADLNSIVSVSTGAVIWTSGNSQALSRVGALAGTRVVFVSGARVLAQTY
jgi:hypothetical protein